MRAWPLAVLGALFLVGCASEPDGSVPPPTTAQLETGIDRALDGVEKLSSKDRMSAHASLDDLIREKGTPAQKERYAKLMAH